MPHPIDLIFAAPDGKTVKKGPYPRFCLQGETLREEPGGPSIAVHDISGCWTANDSRALTAIAPFEFSCLA